MGREGRAGLRKDYLLAAAAILRQTADPTCRPDAYDEAVIGRSGVARDPAWLKEELVGFVRAFDRRDPDLLVCALAALGEARDAALLPVFRAVLADWLDRPGAVVQQTLLSLAALGAIDLDDGAVLRDHDRSLALARSWLADR
jgi:hypothetical protein